MEIAFAILAPCGFNLLNLLYDNNYSDDIRLGIEIFLKVKYNTREWTLTSRCIKH